jgi:hypothetical protein
MFWLFPPSYGSHTFYHSNQEPNDVGLGPLYIRAHPLGPFPNPRHQPMRVLRLPKYGPKGFILGVNPLHLKLTWLVTWRRFGGKYMGLRQKNGSRVYAYPSLTNRPISPNFRHLVIN